MKLDGKKMVLMYLIVLVGFCLIIGSLYHFTKGYDLKNVVETLAIQIFLVVVASVFVIAIVWLLFFVISKIKR